MEQHPELSEIIYLLQGSQIQNYDLGKDTLRLVLSTPISYYLNPPANLINLVLKQFDNFYYLSYTQTPETRTEERNPDIIFSLALVLQGGEMQKQNHFIIYCNSLNTIEAGELHFHTQNWHLYDEEFSRISFQALQQAFYKRNTSF